VKVKLDENLPNRLVGVLRDLGHDADTVIDEALTGRDDTTVFHAAQAAGRFFMTQDLDFADIRRFAPGTHHGLLILRLRNPGARSIYERMLHVFATEPVETWPRSTIVVTDRKLRIYRASGSM